MRNIILFILIATTSLSADTIPILYQGIFINQELQEFLFMISNHNIMILDKENEIFRDGESLEATLMDNGDHIIFKSTNNSLKMFSLYYIEDNIFHLKYRDNDNILKRLILKKILVCSKKVKKCLD